MRDLCQMVDNDDIESCFDNIAQYLFSECEIDIKGNIYYFKVLEFYYFSPNHQDTNVHKHYKQKSSNRLYFHSKGFGGVDLTFGDNNSWGGVLIKGLIDKNKNILKQIESFKTIRGYLNYNGKRREEMNKIEESLSLPITESLKPRDIRYEKNRRIGVVKKDDFSDRRYRYILLG